MYTTLQDLVSAGGGSENSAFLVLRQIEEDYGRGPDAGMGRKVSKPLDPAVWAWYDNQIASKGGTFDTAQKIMSTNDQSRVSGLIASGAINEQGLTPQDVERNRVADAEYQNRLSGMQGNAPAPGATQVSPDRQVNIYNPATGQYGFQSPGAPIPDGWQPVGGGQTQGPPNSPQNSPQTSGGANVGQSYTVQAGDTLSAIAARFGVPVQSITGYRSGNPNLIFPGETLSIGGQNAPMGSTAPQGGLPTTTAQSRTTMATTPQGSAGTGESLSSLLQSVGIAMNNRSSLSDIVKELSTLYGMDEINGEIKKLDDDYAEQVADINDDPWISEGIRTRRLDKAKTKYESQKKSYTERLQLRGDIIGKAVTLYNAEKDDEQQLLLKALDFRLDELKDGGSDATTDIREYNMAVQQGFTGSLLDWMRTTANLKRTNTTINVETSSASSDEQQLLNSRNQGVEADGVYADPNLYASLRSRSPLGAAEFDRRFSYLVNPASRSRLGIKSGDGGLDFGDIPAIQ